VSWIVEQHPSWPAIAPADWLDTIMTIDVPDREHRKQGRAIGRWTVPQHGTVPVVVFLKRHYTLPWWCGILAKLSSRAAHSPGLQEWQNLRWAKRHGLPVPVALCAGERRGPGLAVQSFLAVEELDRQEPLHLAVPLARARLCAVEFERWKRGLTAELSRLCVLLHQQHHYHKDLYFCHFYIADHDLGSVPASWANRVTMIDFHRLAYHRLARPWHVLKDLAQLLYSSSVIGVSPVDRARFWKLYRAGAWANTRAPGAWLSRLIRWKAARYQVHHERKAARRAAERVPV